MAKQRTHARNSEATRARILAAAKSEFAKHGLSGARVDVIAARSEANKRMIYHYFGSKEDLFAAVVEAAYIDIRNAEQALQLDDLPAREALETFVRFTWNYYLENPEFITLVNSENLHRARHVEKSEKFAAASRQLSDMIGSLLERGVAEGVFRPGLDPVQLNITVAAIGYYYLTNQFTGSILYQRDLMDPAALNTRLAFNIDTIMRLVASDD